MLICLCWSTSDIISVAHFLSIIKWSATFLYTRTETWLTLTIHVFWKCCIEWFCVLLGKYWKKRMEYSKNLYIRQKNGSLPLGTDLRQNVASWNFKIGSVGTTYIQSKFLTVVFRNVSPSTISLSNKNPVVSFCLWTCSDHIAKTVFMVDLISTKINIFNSILCSV